MPDVTPTLEQIAATEGWYGALASEVIAVRGQQAIYAGTLHGLRERLDALDDLARVLLKHSEPLFARVSALESAADETRNLVIGLGIDTTEETDRLDAHVSALEEAGAGAEGEHHLPTLIDERDSWKRWCLRAEAERDKLRTLLDRALEPHAAGCHVHDEPYVCTCGLTVALATTSEEREA